MAGTSTPAAGPGVTTLAGLLERLGSVPLDRVAYPPAPGTATEADVLRRPDGEKRLYELVDGVLMEKPRGYYESLLAGVLVHELHRFLERHRLGLVLLPDAPLRLRAGLVRLPDVSFVRRERLPRGPREPVLDCAPDLAVEIVSPGNTAPEMDRKLNEYFSAGTQLVWYVYPERREVEVYTSPDEVLRLTEAEELDGGEVLPGFRLRVGDWFARADELLAG